MPDESKKQEVSVEELIIAARDAAIAGKSLVMIERLIESKFLDVLYRYMEIDWAHLDGREIVSSAVNEFYERARGGTRINKPMGYLFMTVKKMAVKEHERRKGHIEISEVIDDASVRSVGSTFKNRVARDDEKVRALAIARSLVPRIGQAMLRNIATYYLEAVERDVSHIDDQELADTFGLAKETARRLKNRALERLAREAREAGISLEGEFGPDVFGEEEDNEDGDYGKQ